MRRLGVGYILYLFTYITLIRLFIVYTPTVLLFERGIFLV